MRGQGTRENPYIIKTYADLNAVRANLSACYELGADIDCYGQTFEPIGHWSTDHPGYDTFIFRVYGVINYLHCFTGRFEGKGYAIKNLTVNIFNESPPHNYYAGLFRGLAFGAQIRNLILQDVNITAFGQVGGLAGAIRLTTIKNCGARSNIQADRLAGGLIGLIYRSHLIRCWADSLVLFGDGVAGGLVGSAYESTINRCFSFGKVQTDREDAKRLGGFIAEVDQTTISDCFARCHVIDEFNNADVGGFIGLNISAPIINCYSTGKVIGEDRKVGGFQVTYWGSDDPTTNCFWDVQSSGQTRSAGGIGQTTIAMKSRHTYIGWDFSSIWAIDSSNNNGYPYLRQISIKTLQANNISTHSATLNGIINAAIDYPSFCGFQYWRAGYIGEAVTVWYNPWYGIPPQLRQPITGTVHYTYTITGLRPHTLYQFCAIGVSIIDNETEYYRGNILSFRTTMPSPIFGDNEGYKYISARDAISNICSHALGKFYITPEAEAKYEARPRR